MRTRFCRTVLDEAELVAIALRLMAQVVSGLMLVGLSVLGLTWAMEFLGYWPH